MHKLSVNKIRETVKSGVFTICDYPKKDGTRRNVNARFDVTKHLKGGEWNGTIGKHLPIYDMQNKGYKMLLIENLDGLKLKANGEEYLLTID